MVLHSRIVVLISVDLKYICRIWDISNFQIRSQRENHSTTSVYDIHLAETCQTLRKHEAMKQHFLSFSSLLFFLLSLPLLVKQANHLKTLLHDAEMHCLELSKMAGSPQPTASRASFSNLIGKSDLTIIISQFT